MYILTFFIVFMIQSRYKSLLTSSYIMQTPKHFTLHNTWKYQSIIHKANIMSLPLSILFSFTSILLYAFPLQAAFLSPVRKDHTTLQYTLPILLKTPPQSTQLVLDLGGSFSWINCYNNYTSSTYHHIFCDTPLCTYTQSLACGNCYDKPFGPNCANNTCDLFPENPIIRDRGLDSVGLDDALTDTLALSITEGKAQGPLGFVNDFIFSCAKASLLKKLAKGATGMAGLGRSNISLQAQVSDSVSASRYFALCLSGSAKDPGVVFFGTGGPYYFLPNIDLSSFLIYTPLLVNPTGSTLISYPHPSDEYYIGLTSILVNGKIAPINGSLLAIDESGFGGTKISTVNPYTMLQTSIYKAVTEAFVKESSAFNLTVTKPVKPFNVCYPAGQIMSSPVGPRVPTVDLVLHGKNVVWRIYGSNSMVRIRKKGLDLWCLGFVDGGANERTSIVIGGYQIEDNLLQFDLKSNRLGLTSSILVHGTTCANFNFTAKSRKN